MYVYLLCEDYEFPDGIYATLESAQIAAEEKHAKNYCQRWRDTSNTRYTEWTMQAFGAFRPGEWHDYGVSITQMELEGDIPS